MGSTAEVLVEGDPTIVPAVFVRLRAIEQRLSRFLPDSELNHVLERAGRWTPASPDLVSALRWAIRLRRETGGLFDPSIRTALERWGYDRTFIDVTGVDVAPAATPVRPAAIEIAADGRSVWIEPGATLDLGGIGKGLAADIAVREAVRLGARSVLVSLGGDLCAAGEPPVEGWDVPLLHPTTDLPFARHRLHDGALVMSTIAMRRWRVASTIAHHLIDPRTGTPCIGRVIAVAVVSASAARGEALAKAAVIAGDADGQALLRRAGVSAWVLLGSGDVLTVTAS